CRCRGCGGGSADAGPGRPRLADPRGPGRRWRTTWPRGTRWPTGPGRAPGPGIRRPPPPRAFPHVTADLPERNPGRPVELVIAFTSELVITFTREAHSTMS